MKNDFIIISSIIILMSMLFIFNSYPLIQTDTTYTELYFKSPKDIPHAVAADENVSVDYSIVNREGRTMQYNYRITTEGFIGNRSTGVNVIDEQTLLLKDGEKAERTLELIPESGHEQVRTTIELTNNDQKISFLIEVTDGNNSEYSKRN